MHPDVESLLLSHQQIVDRTAQLGEAITRDYQGRELTAICVLKGAAVFFSQLIQQIKLPVTLDFIQVSSYGKSTVSDGKLAWLKQPEFPVAGKHILLVEDILDTGFTLWTVRQKLLSQGAESVKICTLLDKPARRKVPQIQADYVGYTVPDAFLVGYGLDYAEKYRNLPYIGVLKSSCIAPEGDHAAAAAANNTKEGV